MKPATGSVEELRKLVADVAAESSSFELWIPASLTLRGRSVPRDLAVAIVLDDVLARGFMPDGVMPEPAGSTCVYRRARN